MKRLLLCVLALVCGAFLFASCSKSGVPDGMTLASDPDLDGFVLYVPKGYTIDRSTGVLTAYVSDLDPTSVSAVMVAPEEDTIADYWAANLPSLEAVADAGTEIRFDESNAEIAVGKDELAGRAWIYSFTRGGINYKVTQIFVPKGEKLSDGMAILTYTGKIDATVTGTVGYTKYVDYFQKTVDNFAFREPSETPKPAEKITDGAPEGMQLASTPKIAHYKLYLPLEWNADMKTGISSGYAADGAGVSVISLYPEGFKTIEEYFAAQKEAYEVRYADVTVLNGDEPEQCKVDGCDAFRYECRVSRRGDGRVVRFSVVYVFLRKGMNRGLYTVTLSAVGETEAEADEIFARHETDFAAVLDAFRFN